jgi:hypothetical protein
MQILIAKMGVIYLTQTNDVCIKKGRIINQYLKTNFNTIDFILSINRKDNPFQTKTKGMSVLGFYSGIKRYINRKNNTKDNQITYTQKYLTSQLGISNNLYYSCLKILYNTSMLDIEKTISVKYYVYKSNSVHTDTFITFSSITNEHISLKELSITEYLSKKTGYASGTFKILEVRNNTQLIIHEYPENNSIHNGNLIESRSWEKDLSSYFSKSTVFYKKDPVSPEEKHPHSPEEKDPVSHEGNLNNIINYINKNNNNNKYNNSINLIDIQHNNFITILKNTEIDTFEEKTKTFITTVLKELYLSSSMSKSLDIPFSIVKQKIKLLNREVYEIALKNYTMAKAKNSIKNERMYFAKCLLSAIDDYIVLKNSVQEQDIPLPVDDEYCHEKDCTLKFMRIEENIELIIKENYDQDMIKEIIKDKDNPYWRKLICKNNKTIIIKWSVEKQSIEIVNQSRNTDKQHNRNTG